MEELWKDIPWFETYQVSNLSNVTHFWVPIHPCKMKIWYRCIKVYKDKKQYTLYLHRLLGELFIPNPENKKTINHKDWNKDNNLLENLEWATQSENNQHAVDVLWRRSPRTGIYGKDNPFSKKILQIDKLWNIVKEWYSGHGIRRELGISNKNISSVCTWRRPYAGWYSWRFSS